MPKKRIDEETFNTIKRLIETGKSCTSIAEFIGYSDFTVGKVKKHKSYKDYVEENANSPSLAKLRSGAYKKEPHPLIANIQLERIDKKFGEFEIKMDEVAKNVELILNHLTADKGI